MKSKIWLILIFVVWGLWLITFLFLTGSEVDRNLISTKTGLVISAHCVEGRSGRGVKFKVDYDVEDSVRDDFISLPLNYSCNEDLLTRFEMKKIKITAYKNYYLGVVVDGLQIRVVDDSIRAINDKRDVIYFSFFIALIATLAMYMKMRHTKS